MSNALALATVTATLQRLLQTEVALAIPSVTVKIGQPKAPESVDALPEINICLYQVTPNTAYRNADLPTRDVNGQWLTKPQVALDLHYLFTFYGDQLEILPQRLLGHVVSILDQQPVLTPDMIQETIGQPALDFLADSDLAEQIEQVKFIPQLYSLEEATKLWSIFFQTPYSLSVAYQGSVVLIESAVTPISVPLVKTRGIRHVFTAADVHGDDFPDLVAWASGSEDTAHPNSVSLTGTHYLLLDPGLLSGATNFTITGDVKLNSTNGWRTLLHLVDSSGLNVLRILWTDNYGDKFIAYIGGEYFPFYHGHFAAEVDVWHTWTLERSGNRIGFFLDENLLMSRTAVGAGANALGSVATAVVGQWINTADPLTFIAGHGLNGSIDNFSYFL
ncbi:MAG: Pvc16 family protein [Pseudomonadales bacterium]